MVALRIGLIACSSVARRRFLPALVASAVARVERVGSRDPAKAQALARKFSCTKHGSYEAVLDDPDVDAIYISTPPLLHKEWVLKAAAQRKHVLCEKPAFCDYASAAEAVAACRANGVRLLEGYTFRFHPQHEFVRSAVAQGRIGAPRFFHAEFTYPRPPAGDIRLDPAMNGGVFCDSAGYPIAAALLQLAGQPVSVACQLIADRETGVDNAFSCSLRFSGGEIAQMLVAFEAHYRSRYAVTGTRGRIELERAFSVAAGVQTTALLETDSGEERISLASADQFGLMIEDFAAQIAGATPLKDYEGDLLRQRAIMDAAWRSHREHRVIELPEDL